MILGLTAFSGEIPRLAADALPSGNAQYAKDCDFTKGDLRGLRQKSVAFVAPTTVKSMYVHPTTGRWYSWPTDVDVVTGPIVDDQYSRFYFTDGTHLRVASAVIGGSGATPTSYRAGVPTPTMPPVFTGNGAVFPEGVTGYQFAAYCLRDGAQTLITTTTTTVTVGSTYRINMPANACGATTTTTSGSTANRYQVGTATDISDYPAIYNQPVYATASNAALSTGVLYMLDVDSVATTLLMTVTGTGGVVATRTFTRQSNGDYCTQSGATTLAVAEETAAGALVLELLIGNSAGVYGAADWKVSIPLTGSTPLPVDIAGGAWSVSAKKDGTTDNYLISIGPGSTVETRAYVYTYRNIWGEEGAPSQPAMLDVTPGLGAYVQVTLDTHTDYRLIDTAILYRTNTGSNGTDYQFVKEIPVSSPGAYQTLDNVPNSDLSEVMSTLGYEPAPDGCTAATLMGNGVLALLRGNEVWLSEPFLPYAFNPASALSLPSRAIGCAAQENSLFVTTTSTPYLITGVSPEAMTMQPLPETQAGLNKNSICAVGDKIAYLSNDGIVLARGLDTTIGASMQLFTRTEWRARYGSSLSQARLSSHDGYLLGTFDDGAEGFILRLDEAEGAFVRYSETVAATHVWAANDWLYLAYNATVYAFQGSSDSMPWVWWSKDSILPAPHNFGAFQITGSGSVTVYVYADGSLQHTEVVSLTGGPVMFRLPSGFTAGRWSIKLSGSGGAYVRRAYLVTSPSELRGV